MKKVDYLIVGCGLAGIAFCEQLRAHNKSYVVFDNASQHSSTVAAGLYNPVILKRFTEVWKAKEQLELTFTKYRELEELLYVKLNYELPVYRRFTSVEEQNEWFLASDKPSLEAFLSTNLKKNINAYIDAPFGFGMVNKTGRIDTNALIDGYRSYLKSQSLFYKESFDYDDLNISPSEVVYKNINAKHIVFAEGFGVVKNPYFDTLPLNVAKGEVITIKAPDLNINFILKSSVFLVPEGDDLYYVGATYDWKDKTDAISKEGREELVAKLSRFLKCDFTVVNQLAGIRPTVKDRRPLVGKHPLHQNMYVLNGLGTRGVMIAPYVAKQLYHFVEHGKSLDNEIDIDRFTF
ncbi:FAD-dependent oxidoreductase [Flavobacteriales bacterium 34_180_T64]|nr:FAD-dependent oxidoreductase [Flavobacteriales bacterium 34_180_T64]